MLKSQMSSTRQNRQNLNSELLFLCDANVFVSERFLDVYTLQSDAVDFRILIGFFYSSQIINPIKHNLIMEFTPTPLQLERNSEEKPEAFCVIKNNFQLKFFF